MPQATAKAVLELFISILNSISMPYKREKLEDLDTMITYLNIQLDTVNMSASITASKRRVIIQMLRPWLHKSYSTLAEIQSLIGSLMWAAQIAPHSRTFIQALINRTKGKNWNTM